MVKPYTRVLHINFLNILHYNTKKKIQRIIVTVILDQKDELLKDKHHYYNLMDQKNFLLH